VFLQACKNIFAMTDNDLFKASDLFDGLGMHNVCMQHALWAFTLTKPPG